MPDDPRWRWQALPIDRDAAHARCLELLQALIRIDTTNPPGNELPAATLLADYLRERDLDPEVLETAPGRGCVVTRMRGDGSLPPLLLNAHLDVVEADAARWTHPPFAAEIHDGYVWGRGAIDMKHMAAMSAVVMGMLAELRVPLRRDVIFAGVADEEAGCDLGSSWLVEHCPERVRAEYMLGEVGGFSYRMMGRTFYMIQVAEKGVCWLRAHTHGAPGHGSIPARDSALVRLAEALARLGRTRLPQHAVPAVQTFLEQVAQHLPFPASRVLPWLGDERWGYRLLDAVIRDPERRATFEANLANTANPTILRAGRKVNVVPGYAEAHIDARTLPGQTSAMLLDELRGVLGSDVDLEVLRDLPPVVTPQPTPLWDHLTNVVRRHDPEGIPVPYMVSGFTDAKAYSRLGTHCYGFAPLRFDPSHDIVFSKLYHGHDERIPVEGLRWGLGALWDAVTGFCV